ncbi:hypothetical protein BT96DRAFT_1081401 [Gymnopus androsaceus JB14]|uniref:REJ domain-containing protein n=1 Tax=Gymnopus androsaceus JB14 TaxID=1447944 RepID=A0A6A4I025_9AGAR|nr:hypothetical protein BT96DRAFT_1081401 [Gymnopus androsaceus JB14]
MTSEQSSSSISSSSSDSSNTGSGATSTAITTLTAPLTTSIQATTVSTSNSQAFTTVIETQSLLSAGAIVTSTFVYSTTAAESSSSSVSLSRKSSDAGAIISGVVSGFSGLAVILAIVYAIWKRWRRKHDLDKAFEAFNVDDIDFGFTSDSGRNVGGQQEKGYRKLKGGVDNDEESGGSALEDDIDGPPSYLQKPHISSTPNDASSLHDHSNTQTVVDPLLPSSKPQVIGGSSEKRKMNNILVLLDDSEKKKVQPVSDGAVGVSMSDGPVPSHESAPTESEFKVRVEDGIIGKGRLIFVNL